MKKNRSQANLTLKERIKKLFEEYEESLINFNGCSSVDEFQRNIDFMHLIERVKNEYKEDPSYFSSGGYLEVLMDMFLIEETRSKNLLAELNDQRAKLLSVKEKMIQYMKKSDENAKSRFLLSLDIYEKELKKMFEETKKMYIQMVQPKDDETQEEDEYTAEDYKKDLRTIKNNCKNLADNLKEVVIGQDSHIDELVAFLRAHFSGLGEEKPTAIFFHGPTGVGKTYTIENLNNFLFKGTKCEPPLFWINGADYAQEHYVSNLIGSPQGYVGYKDEGRLISHIKENPAFSILLFDEIEKAHPRLHTFLLNLIDKGFVFSGAGQKYECSRYIIGFTSNIGEQDFAHKKNIGLIRPDEATRRKDREKFILESIMDNFPPEFRGRISAFLHYNELPMDKISRILSLEIAKINKRAINHYKKRIIVTEKGHNKLLEIAAPSASYGARGIKDTLKKYIESNVAVIDALESGRSVIIDESGGELVYEPVIGPPLLSSNGMASPVETED